MQQSVAQCRSLLMVAEPILSGLGDEHLNLEPIRGAKTAGWLLGHLCVTGDFGRRLCGRPPICPKEWRSRYNPGSQPSHSGDDYPPMAELVAAFRAVYADLADAALAANAATLESPNPYEPTRGRFPRAGDFVAYLLGGHLGYHLGQLSTWRAAAGLVVPR